jgi:hypothetical protein
MTVNELIKLLEPLDGTLLVYVPDYDDPYKVKEAQTVGITSNSVDEGKHSVIIDFE